MSLSTSEQASGVHDNRDSETVTTQIYFPNATNLDNSELAQLLTAVFLAIIQRILFSQLVVVEESAARKFECPDYPVTPW